MTNLKQAAEMALKVLEEINEISKPPTGLPLPAEIDGAMEALRQALAEQDCEQVAKKHRPMHNPDAESVADECVGAIKARREI